MKTCKDCQQPVRPIDGKQLLRGKAPAYRHVKPPVGCRTGDPLIEDQVQ